MNEELTRAQTLAEEITERMREVLKIVAAERLALLSFDGESKVLEVAQGSRPGAADYLSTKLGMLADLAATLKEVKTGIADAMKTQETLDDAVQTLYRDLLDPQQPLPLAPALELGPGKPQPTGEVRRQKAEKKK